MGSSERHGFNFHEQKAWRVKELGSRAQKALAFTELFGLQLKSLQLSDKEGHRYSYSISSEGSEPNTQPTSSPQDTPDDNTPNKYKHFNNLAEEEKAKVESLLFLMDKFSVGDTFMHELSLVIEDMPKSYLIKECRDKISSTCAIYPIQGSAQGARISFTESLTNKLKLMVSDFASSP